MIASINQPAYLPWLGYFERIAVSDVHVILDHVQFEKNSFTNRNRVRTSSGWSWLTVPVQTKGRFGHSAIDRLEIDNAGVWSKKHWATLRQSYAKAPYFRTHEPFFEQLYGASWENLGDLCRALTSYLLDAFGIATPLVFSSDLAPQGAKDELVLELCRKVGADHYLSGALGRNYLREGLFREAGVSVSYQDYHHPTYPQVYSPFEPYMAAVDLLFNCGPRSLEILTTAPGGTNP